MKRNETKMDGNGRASVAVSVSVLSELMGREEVDLLVTRSLVFSPSHPRQHWLGEGTGGSEMKRNEEKAKRPGFSCRISFGLV